MKLKVISQLFTSWNTSPCYFPKDESKTVHISHDVRLKMVSIQAFIQHLRRHIAFCSYTGVGRYVHLVCITKRKRRGEKGIKYVIK